jgi:predicted PurR-regulated permease PerM
MNLGLSAGAEKEGYTMDKPDQPETDKIAFHRVVETIIRVAAIAMLAIYCFQIVRPFVIPVVWGVIIAVAAHPGFLLLRAALGGRNTMAAILFTVLGAVVLVTPTVMLSDTMVVGARDLKQAVNEGTLDIPPPPQGVAHWPVIGEPLAEFWDLASHNLEEALNQVRPQLKATAGWLLSLVAGAGVALLQFVAAIVIAGVLLAHDEAGKRAARAIAARLADERGIEFAELMRDTIRSVARGILGVAFLQSILAGLGFLAVGVPGAGLWALLCLLLAVVQIGIFPVVVPAVIYVFYTAETSTAVVFLIWSILVSMLDNVLKPLLLGRGVNVPMAVIFAGAIGGFLASGIVGLFIGSVILVLGYQLFMAWLYGTTEAVQDTAQVSGPRKNDTEQG